MPACPANACFRIRLDLFGLAAQTALGDGPALLLIGDAIAAPVLCATAGPTTQPTKIKQQSGNL